MRKWNYEFDVPDEKKVRMIVYTDAKNEADDQFTIAHDLMTPKFIIKGIIAAHFDTDPKKYAKGTTAEEGLKEIHKVLKLMDMEGCAPVVKGAEHALTDPGIPILSDGARLIIEEAMKNDPHPLFIGVQGSCTDLASAIIAEPRICDRMTAIWIGGGSYPKGGWEFNFSQDVIADNVIMSSDMPIWQVPRNAYATVNVTLAMLQKEVRPYGAIGKYLFRQMVELNDDLAWNAGWPHGESWALGDDPTCGLLLTYTEEGMDYDMIEAPVVNDDLSYTFTGKNRKIRVYRNVFPRLTLEDFFAKLQINYPERAD